MNELMLQNDIIVNKVLLIETGTGYKDVPQRGYSLSVGQKTLTTLDTILTSQIGGTQKQVTDNELAINVPELIHLNPRAVGIANIPNGWGCNRLRFLIEVIQDRHNGVRLLTYLQGFTDYHDPSLTGLLDPNMTLHINSVVNVTQTISEINGVRQLFSRVVSMYNVISDMFGRRTFEEVQSIDNPNIKLCRPTDIASNLFAMELANGGADMRYTTMNNMTDTVTNYKPATSNRSNGNPYKYMSTTLNAFTTTKQASDIGYANTDLFASTSNVVREPDLAQCIFIDKLMQLRGYTAESPSSFTLAELETISPGSVNARTTLVSRDAGQLNVYNNALYTDDTAELIQPTAEAVKSGSVASSITSIMLDNLVTRLGFSSTNYSGQPEVIITDMNTFMDGVDPVIFVERVKNGILSIIVPMVSDNNLSTYELFVTADLLGDINIGIQLNSNYQVVMRYPAFADSLYSPVISKVGENQILINDFQTLLDHTVLSKFDTGAW